MTDSSPVHYEASSEILGNKLFQQPQSIEHAPAFPCFKLQNTPLPIRWKRSLDTASNDTVEDASEEALSSDDEPWIGGVLVEDVAKYEERQTARKRNCFGFATPITTFTSLPDECTVQLWMRDESCLKVSKSLLMEVENFKNLFSRNSEQSEYRLIRDQPDAMKVLMAILHHKLLKLPEFLSTTQLFHLATVCNNYNVANLVLPHVESRMWIKRLWEDGKPYDMSSWEQWLWILHVFPTTTTERGPQRERVLDVLSADAILYKGFWCFKVCGSYGEISELRSPTNLPLLEETIQERRRKLWGDFLEQCQRHYSITGELAVFLHNAESTLPSNTSFRGELKRLLKQHQLSKGFETIIRDKLQEFKA